MPTPYFVADAAQVTVMRSLASTAFGTYDLTLPEGITLEDLYTLAAPGNKLGYVAALGGKRVGGMARRFVRSDVSITTAMGEQEPATNVEEVLDAAAKRTSGDFFLETDISKAGLGPWVPFKDFQVGDKARVEIWGTTIVLPITRIDDDVVHVGGQLVSDADARLAENEIIRRALVDDRRDLFGLDEKIESSVSSATQEWGGKLEAQKQEILDEYQELDNALKEANREAEDYNKKLESLTRALQGENQDLDAASKLVLQRIQSLTDTANTAGDWVAENQNDVNKAIALALSAQGQYNEFNNIKWFKDEEWKKEQVKINQSNELFKKMQEQVNSLNQVRFIDLYEWRKQVNATKAAQDDINKANDKFKAAQLEYNRINDKLQRYQNRMLERLGGAQKQMAESQSKAVDELMATKAGANRSDASVVVKSDGGWTVKLPRMSGTNLVHVKWYSKKSNNTLTLGGEMLFNNIGSFSVGPEDDYVHIRWTTSSSTVETIDHQTSSTSVPQAEWKTILSAFASNSGRNLVLDANITWSAADRGSTYGIRLVVGGTVIGTEQTKKLGPETVFGEGERGQAVNGTKTQIRRGDRIELQAYCGAFPGLSRRIKFASMNGTYTT